MRAATATVLLLALWRSGCREAPRRWSIGIYRGSTPFDLVPAERNPVLTAADLGMDGEFVADPFLLPRGGRLFLFFEVWRRGTKQGDVAWAERTSAGAWRVALDEPFHLSYPFVFEHPIVAGDRCAARPGGRPIVWRDHVLRFAQCDRPVYGVSVRAFEVTDLSPSGYAERPAGRDPLLTGSGAGWNAAGMHHLDPLVDARGVTAAVDGWRLDEH